MVLPNCNAAQAGLSSPDPSSPVLTPQMRTILHYISEHGQITDGEVQALLKLKKTRAYILVRQMREMGLIIAEGRGKEKKYRSH